MWSHTRSLECLVLAASIAPAELVRVSTMIDTRAGTGGAGAVRAAVGVPVAYAAVCSLAIGVAATGGFTSWYLRSWPVDASWICAAVLAGCAVIGLEFLVGAAPQLMRGRWRGLRFGVVPDAVRPGPVFLAAIIATAAVEEVLYRGLWMGTLERLGLASAAALGVSAFAYALGHVFFGMTVVLQKTASGLVFGALLVGSGGLVTPLAAHIVQNLVVFGLAANQGGRR